ncbi:MAG: cytochrome c3 family protein, partial [Ignavibacteriales bacterium]|nr:cytochrome c3 family protein [Ignavibacteriales bacterium]
MASATSYEKASDPSHSVNNFDRICTTCHTEVTWSNAKYSHKSFQFLGVHGTLTCNNCHQSGYPGTIAGVASDHCYTCHAAFFQSAPNHVSGGYPHDCTACHSTTGSWSNVKAYTHTSFTFNGAHATIKTTCTECHITGKTIPAGTTNDACNNCHSTAGVATTKYESVTSPSHVTNSFSRTCADCHTNTAWTPARYTHRSFQFSGIHSTLTCTACHSNGYPGSYAGVSQDNCNACHSANYQSAPNHVSSAYPRTCASCHSTTGSWSNVTAYTHSGFTFTGAHSALRTLCSECHIAGKTIPAGTTNSSCNNCHSAAGVATTKYESVTSTSHITNTFSRTCTDCHTNTSWTPARFTHRVFQLSGA